MITMEDLWELKGFSPTNNQKKAILHTKGPLFLTAGPGSGKTRVILWRTLNLVVFNNVKPDEIFLGTFTEKAAKQLKDGLHELLGLVTNITNVPYDIASMSIGTIHSICQHLLTDRRFTEGERKRPPLLMDSLSQYFKIYKKFYWIELLERAGFEDIDETQLRINQYFGRVRGESRSKHAAVIALISFFNRLSEEDANLELLTSPDPFLDKLFEAYRLYRSDLEEQNQADFSTIQLRAYELIRSSSASHSVFKHIIIDEYQDTNHIQEKIFFELADGNHNLCVVGDDDQALYRFRGATVENLVEFEDRCFNHLHVGPTRINLSDNFRSRNQIVEFFKGFMDRIDWKKESGKGYYRVMGKDIISHSTDKYPSVIVSHGQEKDEIYSEFAALVKRLKSEGKIKDYNQVAVLFPSIRSDSGPTTRVQGLMDAFDEEGIPYYAPRAGRFLNIEESLAVFGLLFMIFGKPTFEGRGRGAVAYDQWMRDAKSYGQKLCKEDAALKLYVNDRKAELKEVYKDYQLLIKAFQDLGWELDAKLANINDLRKLFGIRGLSKQAQKNIASSFFAKAIQKKIDTGVAPSYSYLINRIASVDWNVLDLFYRFGAFKYFYEKYQDAEDGSDEGPISNLGLISQYLSRFMEEYKTIITGALLENDKFQKVFFLSYIYALYRLQEGEFEDAEDPFPRGRVSFLTIHQSKGLEFPVVILGNVYRQERDADEVEKLVRQYVRKGSEPLNRISAFDNARMFYVALSRAQNLLVLPRYRGRGQRISEPFKTIYQEAKLHTTESFSFDNLPSTVLDEDDIGKTYSYTADYLNYLKCPRNYMAFRKYGFVASRAQTMMFGSLVHQTIEDLEHLVMAQRKQQ